MSTISSGNRRQQRNREKPRIALAHAGRYETF